MSRIENFPLMDGKYETPERILKEALSWEGIRNLVVIADVDGEVYVSGTQKNQTDVIGLLELGKYKLIVQEQ